MSSRLIANRYARALVKIADKNGALAPKALDFFASCDELFANVEARKILRSPVMPSNLKNALLSYAAEKSQAGKEFAEFGSLVVEAGRTTLIPEMAKAFRQMLDEKRGVASAVATTAEPLTDALTSDLTKSLEAVFKKKITLKNEVDKKVLGGVVVSVGNYTIDMSLRSRLNSVAEHAQR